MRFGSTQQLADDQRLFRLEVIDEVIPRKGLLLEIGAGAEQFNLYDCKRITLDVATGLRPSAQGNAEKLPFKDNTFDFVIATEVIEHVRYPRRMLDEFARVLKKGGRVLLSTPNVAHFTNRVAFLCMGIFCDDRDLHEEANETGHIHFFTRKFFRQAMTDSNFNIIKEWVKFVPITGGKYVTGKYIDNILKNHTKQLMLLCEPKK